MKRSSKVTLAAVAGGVVAMLILVLGTVWSGRLAEKDADQAARSVSLLYLDELAGRREQVVESNIRDYREKMNAAIRLINDSDLESEQALQQYQSRIKELYTLENFAFVDEAGTIHTADGQKIDIRVDFDSLRPDEPDVSVYKPESGEKRVIIAAPVGRDLFLEGKS